MDIYRLMVFAKQIEESKINKERKWSRIEGEGFNGHGHSKNRQNSSGHVYCSTPRSEKSNEYSRPTCPSCGMKQKGRCLAGRYDFYRCGENVHMMKDCLKAKANVREDNQVSTNQVEYGPPNRNRFYALQLKGDKEWSVMSLFCMCFFDDLRKFSKFPNIMIFLVILLISLC